MSSPSKMLILGASGDEVVLKFLAHLVKLLTFKHHGQGEGFHNYEEEGKKLEFKSDSNKISQEENSEEQDYENIYLLKYFSLKIVLRLSISN